jgi:hypothetical protein
VGNCPTCQAALDPGAGTCPACGAPAGHPAAARLVLLRGEGEPGTAFPLSGDEVQAGRTQGQVRFPDDPCLAPHHATLLWRDGALLLRDEGAPGGVFVRLRGPTVPLRPGALFAIGPRLLRFAGPLPPPAQPLPDGTRRLGAPRPDGPAVLVEEWLEGGVAGRVYLRVGPSVRVGGAGADIDLGPDPDVAPAHAELLVAADGSARLRDLGSERGTFLRMPPGSERELLDGDAVRLGREVLRVELA